MISHYLASRWNLSQPCPGLQAVYLGPSQRIELPADLLKKKSQAGLFQHGHRAQQLEDLRLAERQRGSPRREAVASLPGSPSLERVASKIEVAPVQACQVARLPGCLVHTIGSLQPAAAHASAICERSPLLALRAPSMSCGPNLAC